MEKRLLCPVWNQSERPTSFSVNLESGWTRFHQTALQFPGQVRALTPPGRAEPRAATGPRRHSPGNAPSARQPAPPGSRVHTSAGSAACLRGSHSRAASPPARPPRTRGARGRAHAGRSSEAASAAAPEPARPPRHRHLPASPGPRLPTRSWGSENPGPTFGAGHSEAEQPLGGVSTSGRASRGKDPKPQTAAGASGRYHSPAGPGAPATPARAAPLRRGRGGTQAGTAGRWAWRRPPPRPRPAGGHPPRRAFSSSEFATRFSNSMSRPPGRLCRIRRFRRWAVRARGRLAGAFARRPPARTRPPGPALGRERLLCRNGHDHGHHQCRRPRARWPRRRCRCE